MWAKVEDWGIANFRSSRRTCFLLRSLGNSECTLNWLHSRKYFRQPRLCVTLLDIAYQSSWFGATTAFCYLCCTLRYVFPTRTSCSHSFHDTPSWQSQHLMLHTPRSNSKLFTAWIENLFKIINRELLLVLWIMGWREPRNAIKYKIKHFAIKELKARND